MRSSTITGLSLLVLFAGSAAGASNDWISCAAELCEAVYRADVVDKGKSFSFRARVLTPTLDDKGGTMVVEDDTGAMILYTQKLPPEFQAKVGDRLDISGTIAIDSKGTAYARCRRCAVLGSGTASEPLDFEKGAFDEGRLDCRLVRVSGTVIDAFVDEIDANYIFYILNCDGSRLTVAAASDRRSARTCVHSIGRTLSALGLCRPAEGGTRSRLGRYVQALPPGVGLSDEPDIDPFDAPEVRPRRASSPEQIPSFARKRMSGVVLATWHDDRFLIRTSRGDLASVGLAFGDLPKCGETIETVGFPETDLYQINLSRSLWRHAELNAPPPDDAVSVALRTLFTDADGRPRYNSHFHGKLIRIVGRVISLPLGDNAFERTLLQGDGFTVPVDVSVCPGCTADISVGSLVEVVGICVMDTESWSPSNPFPHVKEMFVAVRNGADVRVLEATPWWTPGRLLAVIGGLLLVTCGSLFWNLSLKRIVVRKSHELKREITARLASDLKSRERTRLAVELHDSIAQNLSGASMEIGSAIHLLDEGPQRMLPHLELASRTLHACRDELKDCMWDLRSKALEDADMNGAIRTTLMPYVSDVGLLVRFNVPRARFSDNTAHAILRIVRELTLNAVRHGRATKIRIAGSLEGKRLLFSVQDDGTGFDPNSHPGVGQGHFGLQGVRERINRFGGTMDIASAPGHGTKVTLSMDLTPSDEEEPSNL